MDIIATGFRIKQAIGLTGYNVKDFCERTHRSRVTTALWIAGRGGAIKDANMDELCGDLLSCNVVSDKDWLYTGKGPSPMLLDHDRPDIQSILEPNTLEYFDKNMKAFTKKYRPDQIIECNNKHYYAVAIKTSLDKVKMDSKVQYLIELRSDKKIIGNIIADCKETKHLMIRDIYGVTKCVSQKSLTAIGFVAMLLSKYP